MLATLIPSAGYVELSLPTSTIEYLLRVVDPATFAGVAWTLAYSSNPLTALHLLAGESYQEERIALTSGLVLRVGAVVGSRAELVTWDA